MNGHHRIAPSRTVTRAIAGAVLALCGAGVIGYASRDTLPSLRLPIDYRASDSPRLLLRGTCHTGIFNHSAAEIVSYDPASRRLFSSNGGARRVDVIDIADPSRPALAFSIPVSSHGKKPNSVAVKNGVLAVAVAGDSAGMPGSAVFFDSAGTFIKRLPVGADPDMICFTPDGRFVLVANKGLPSDDYRIDPPGTISIIDLSGGVRSLSAASVKTAGFGEYTRATIDRNIRIFGPKAGPAQDLEPEYIAVSPDSRFAWVSLQKNNAMAKIDIARGSIIALKSLGFKDHRLPHNGFDASDRSDAIEIRNWPVFGMYQPDAIAAYTVNGGTYIACANEGSIRHNRAFTEARRLRHMRLNPDSFPDWKNLRKKKNLGRLLVTITRGDINGDGMFEELYAFGGRSFSILDADLRRVYDSGDDFERITAKAIPGNFNADHRSNIRKKRSPKKGPEPEALAIGEVGGRWYAFIGLERVGGIMLYDISDPRRPRFIQYANNRNFRTAPGNPAAGDLGVECLLFIPAKNAPTGKDLLVSANETSGSISIYEIVTAP